MRKFLICLLLSFSISWTALAKEPVVVELGRGTIHLDTDISLAAVFAVYLRAMLQEGDAHILIDSPGGDFRAAQWLVANFQKIRQQGKTIHCYGNGQVASAAFFIYLHCDKRYVLKSTELFPHKIHIYYGQPMLPQELILDGMETLKEQRDWDNMAIHITGMNKIDYLNFRDSDNDQWSIEKILQKSTKKWFEVVDRYVVEYH